MDRSLSAKVARLVLLRRADKIIEAENVRLKKDILAQMEKEGLDQVTVPSGTITAYDESIETIDPIKLFRAYGKAALAVMTVKIGEAKDLWGKETLVARGLVQDLGSRRKLLSRAAPKKKTLKVAC